jgi:NADH:ubiquinone oxidoreductase subunit K
MAALIVFRGFQCFLIETLLLSWIIVLTIRYGNNKNNFISILLILELLSLTRLFIRSIFISLNGVSTIMFVLITLRVGEAVLGLAILVKLIRWNSTEFLLGGLR